MFDTARFNLKKLLDVEVTEQCQVKITNSLKLSETQMIT
jgi:hypothetical protein